MNTTTQTLEIARIYIEAARAAKAYTESRDRTDLQTHTDLMGQADARFAELRKIDMATYDGPLRDLRHAVVGLEFGMAEARYTTITK